MRLYYDSEYKCNCELKFDYSNYIEGNQETIDNITNYLTNALYEFIKSSICDHDVYFIVCHESIKLKKIPYYSKLISTSQNGNLYTYKVII